MSILNKIKVLGIKNSPGGSVRTGGQGYLERRRIQNEADDSIFGFYYVVK